MRKLASLTLLLAFAFLLTPQQANAQVETEETVFKIGPRATIDINDINDAFGGTFALGGDVRLQIPTLPVQGNGSFDFYFADDPWTVWTIDLNAVYPFAIEDVAFMPYAGAGLGITRWSGAEAGIPEIELSDTDVGLNLVGGAEFSLENGINPFAQAQITVARDADRFGITGGILLDI